MRISILKKTGWFLVIFILSVQSISWANEPVKKEHAIYVSMTMDEFYKEAHNGLVSIPKNAFKHRITDNRERIFLKYKPPFMVVMKEQDIQSYYELIFENGKLTEINKYDVKGNFLNKQKMLSYF